MKLPNKLILIAFLGVFFSCSSNLDFEQVENIETLPVLNVPLRYFTVSAEGFTEDFGTISASNISVNEDIEYRIYENQILRDNIIRQDFDIEIINTFNRAFTISISFLDENESETFTTVLYRVSENQQNFKEKIIIDNIKDVNSSVKNTQKLRLTINLEDPTVPLTRSDFGSFNFKSSTTLFLRTAINTEE